MKFIIDFASSFIEWCNNNQGFTSIILSVITIGITLYVMCKSNDNSKKISEKQAELEKTIALRQEDMQRRQIKVDTYPYRVDCWEKLYMLREETEILKTAFELDAFSDLSISEISKKLQPFYSTYKESIMALNQARNIFPVSSREKIDYIKLCVEKNNSIICKFRIYNDILTAEKKKVKEEEKKHDILQFSKGLNIISRELSEVLRLVDKDLCIADLHLWKGIYDKGE